jgi:hypothetical protein
MTTVLDSSARPMDPRQEGCQRRLVAYSPDEHAALVSRVGCEHEAISQHATTWYHFCDDCRAQRERELAESVL